MQSSIELQNILYFIGNLSRTFLFGLFGGIMYFIYNNKLICLLQTSSKNMFYLS